MSNEALALVVLVGAVLAASARVRRGAWLALRGAVGAALSLAALVVERRRARHGPPPRALPAVRRWRIRLSVRVDGHPVTLADGEVVGPWLAGAEVRDEALRRWAEAGGWAIGARRIYCEAWPLAPATRPTADLR